MPQLVSKDWAATVKLDADDLKDLIEICEGKMTLGNDCRKWWAAEFKKWSLKDAK